MVNIAKILEVVGQDAGIYPGKKDREEVLDVKWDSVGEPLKDINREVSGGLEGNDIFWNNVLTNADKYTIK